MKKTFGIIASSVGFLSSPLFVSWVMAAGTGTEQTGLNTQKVPFTDLGDFIGVLTSVIFIVAGLAAFFYLVLGGFQYITSGGDKAAAQGARDRITYAILGLAIIAASAAIIGVAQAVFGIQILGTIKWPGPSTTVGG